MPGKAPRRARPRTGPQPRRLRRPRRKSPARRTKKRKKTSKKQPDCDELLKAERDKYLRLLAEYDNYRKRSTRERENIYSDALTDTSVTKFLPVYDNLVRALEQSTADEAYRKGVEMIRLSQRHPDEIGRDAHRRPRPEIDPHPPQRRHARGGRRKGRKRGSSRSSRRAFKLGDKVIRFAMVKVAN